VPSGLRRLANHSIRSRRHIRRDRQADLLRCFKVYDELEPRRLLDGDVRGLGAFENLVHLDGGARWFSNRDDAIRFENARADFWRQNKRSLNRVGTFLGSGNRGEHRREPVFENGSDTEKPK
jgi:hypothetical protein